MSSIKCDGNKERSIRTEECGKPGTRRTGHSSSNDLALLLVAYRRIVNILGARLYCLSPMERTYIFQKRVEKKSLNCTLITCPRDESVKCVPLLHRRNIPGVRDTGSRITVHSDCNDGAVLNANPRYRVSATQPH